MSRSLQEMLIINPTPLCDMVPDHGSHKAKAVIRIKLTRPDWGKPQYANVCKAHIEAFQIRARNAGVTTEIVMDYTKKEVAK